MGVDNYKGLFNEVPMTFCHVSSIITVQLNSNLSHARDWRDSTREI